MGLVHVEWISLIGYTDLRGVHCIQLLKDLAALRIKPGWSSLLNLFLKWRLILDHLRQFVNYTKGVSSLLMRSFKLIMIVRSMLKVSLELLILVQHLLLLLCKLLADQALVLSWLMLLLLQVRRSILLFLLVVDLLLDVLLIEYFLFILDSRFLEAQNLLVVYLIS